MLLLESEIKDSHMPNVKNATFGKWKAKKNKTNPK